ncbi:MAG: ATP-binding protein [Planctomycetaceae bacterium]
MTLTNRLLVFFLSMLAIVLIGFSVALYILAHGYLHQQTKDHLETVLNTIGGAIETGPEGVEWEPLDRQQSFQFLTFEDQVAWLVADSHGQLVARSNGSKTDDFLNGAAVSREGQEAGNENRKWVSDSWEAGQNWIHAREVPVEISQPQANDDEARYRALSITAGVSLLPMRATLQRLSYTLIGLSAAIWSIAFVVGRFVCYRALLPVRCMAVAAGDINADDLTQRLPSLKTHDELDDLTQAFNHMLDRLQQSFERQRRFTGDASHQLRTPLTAILGQVEVALRRERTGEEYQQVLHKVQRRTAHLSHMVEALLFLARATAEAQLPALEPLDVSAWLPQHLATWSEHPRFGDILIENTPQDPLIILAQLALLGELLNILLDNACKYSEPGTSITIRAGKTEGKVRLQVEDHGSGLDADQLASLFEPFFRSPEARRRGVDGVGLGLSIAKRLTEVFGGDLTVESQTQQGSRFTLLFPLVQSAETINSQQFPPTTSIK